MTDLEKQAEDRAQELLVDFQHDIWADGYQKGHPERAQAYVDALSLAVDELERIRDNLDQYEEQTSIIFINQALKQIHDRMRRVGDE
jgi:hypothetical protein